MRAIVLGTADRVREHRPGFIDVPHPLGRLHGSLVKVGMMALREMPMRASHLEGGRIAGHAEDGVRIERRTTGHGAILRPPDPLDRAAGRPPSV